MMNSLRWLNDTFDINIRHRLAAVMTEWALRLDPGCTIHRVQMEMVEIAQAHPLIQELRQALTEKRSMN